MILPRPSVYCLYVGWGKGPRLARHSFGYRDCIGRYCFNLLVLSERTNLEDDYLLLLVLGYLLLSLP